jgi:MFS transporter, ACS family, glucarate transporter
MLSDIVIRLWGKGWGRRIVGAAGLMVAGLAIVAVPWVENVVVLGSLLVLAFFGNDLAMAPAWAAAADIGERHTGTVAGTMNMTASLMAAVQTLLIGWLFKSDDLVMPFVLLAASYALGTLAWIGVDVRQTLAESP